MKVGVIGTGYVGLVLGACLAETGNHVICADIDSEKIDCLKKGLSPSYEPGLESLLKHNLAEGRLDFSTDVGHCIENSAVVFIAVGTPPAEDGSADLQYVYSVAETIGQHLNGEKIIITKSTVPIGTTLEVGEIIAEQTDQPFHLANNPEFLKEGTAVEDTMRPDRVIVGTGSEYARSVLEELFSPFLRTGKPVLFMDIASSEVTKYAANTMLAIRISYMNQIAALCEATGADVEMVRKGIGSDPRIGSSFLFAGAGYGGSCFPKDVRALVRTGQEYGLDLSIARSAQEWNERQKSRVVEILSAELGDDLSGRRIAIWGLAFKADTDDLREAVSLTVIEELLDRGASVVVHDPQAMANARKVLPDSVEFASDEYTACEGADALLVLTEWLQYRHPDLEEVKNRLARPLIIDGRNLFKREKMKQLGFTYLSIGRPDVR